jgi:phage gp45-like
MCVVFFSMGGQAGHAVIIMVMDTSKRFLWKKEL